MRQENSTEERRDAQKVASDTNTSPASVHDQISSSGRTARPATLSAFDADSLEYTGLRPPKTPEGREELSQRGRRRKVFNLGGGQYEAVLFGCPVHYLDAAGTWQEIDNTLKAVNEKGTLVCRAAETEVTLFPSGGESLITLKRNGCALSWTINNARPVTPQVVPCVHEETDDHRAVLDKRTGDALYAGLLPGVDVNCHLSEDRFKEEFIFSAPESICDLTFTLRTVGLTLTLSGKQVLACNAQGETVFELPAPFLMDSELEPTYGNVGIALFPLGDGFYTLRYTPDKHYMKHALYPVTLDPVVVYTDRTAAEDALITALVTSTAPDTPMAITTSKCVVNGTTQKLLVKFPTANLPLITSSFYVTKAYAHLYIAEAASKAMHLMVSEVKTPWAVGQSSSSPITYDDPLDYAYLRTSTAVRTKLTYDVSNLVRNWYEQENHGFALSAPSGQVSLYTNYSANYKPYITIQYVSLAGIESYLRYETQSLGRAGTGYVSLFNGNLVFLHTDSSTNGHLLPISVSHAYNSCDHDQNPYGNGYGWLLSTQQSLHREEIADEDGTAETYYVYTTGNGTRHHFKQTSGKWKDMSGLGLTLTLQENATDPTASTATLTDKGDNTLVFPLPSEGGDPCLLQRTTDALGNAATYESTTLTDGAGRETTLTYANNQLHTLQAPYMDDSHKVVYEYSTAGDLISITHEDGKATTYSYHLDAQGQSTHLLDKVTNIDGITVAYTYTAQPPYRVTGFKTYVMEEMAEVSPQANERDALSTGTNTQTENNAANTFTPHYISARSYAYKGRLTIVTDQVPTADGHALVDGKKLFYHFNDHGNCVSVNDELAYGAFTEYAETQVENHPESTSKLQRSVPNMLRNHHFLSSTSTVWVADKLDGTGTCGYSSECNYIGGRAYKLNKTSVTGRISVYQKTYGCVKGKAYTFSVFFQTTSNAEAQVMATYANAAGEDVSVESLPQKSVGTWSRIAVSFTLPVDAQHREVKVRILAAGSKGIVYADGAQLETGMLAGRYNYLHNGDFSWNETGTPSGWTASADMGSDDHVQLPNASSPFRNRPEALNGNILHVRGEPGQDKMLYQAFSCMGSKGDTFVLGGWAAGKSRPSVSGGIFRLELYARPDANAVGVTGTPSFRDVGTVDWSEEWSDWQFAAKPIQMPWKYTAIGVRIRYKNNLNEAEFADLFLYKERFGRSYAYDDNGNLTSIANLANIQSGAAYDEHNNMTSYYAPGRSDSKYTLSYGTTAQAKQHLLRKVKSPLLTYTTTAYDLDTNLDGKGLPTATQTQDKATAPTLFIRGETSYTGSHNYTATQKDARGYTISYSTDETTGTLTHVTDANNQRVDYAYDTLRRTTAVVTQADGKTYRNNYQYDANDRLVSVAHNTLSDTIPDASSTGNISYPSTAADGINPTNTPDTAVRYHFTYDHAGRAKTVKVGNTLASAQTLSENTYNPDGTLHEVLYGNDGKVSYVYDAFKRVTGICYDEETEPRYGYEFAANGQTARVYDRHLSRMATSDYDIANRPMRLTQMENMTQSGSFDVNGGSHLYTGQVTYNSCNKLATFQETVGPDKTEYTTAFTYNVEDKPTKLTYGTDKVTYAYDKLGRMTTSVTTVSGNAYSTAYTYVPGAAAYGTGSTTDLVSAMTQGTGENTETFAYTYDNVGNILSVARTMYEGTALTTKTTTYTYDKLGQLVRTNDPLDPTAGSAGTTWVYEYDCGGNMLLRKSYAFTTAADISTLSPTQTIPYAYGNANWKDLLTAFNGQTMTYDAIGNPLNDGKWMYVWQAGRQLKSMTKGVPNTSGYQKLLYAYNADGLRIQKVCVAYDAATAENTVTGTDYILHGKNIVYARISSGTLDENEHYTPVTTLHTLHFYYNAQGQPLLFDWTEAGTTAKYAFTHNLQGDIVGIRNTSGIEVVRYAYDAWGKPLSVTGSMAATLGQINPFRYRGYAYDAETELYYLRSRYYHPAWERFVNADFLLIDVLLRNNLFSYCTNSPICFKDESGKYPSGAVLSVAASALEYDYVTNGGITKMSNREKKYAILHMFSTFKVLRAANLASQYTDKYYGENASRTDGGRANAFKHAFWNALMVRDLGYDLAREYADNHEDRSRNREDEWLGLPEWQHAEMDLYNNEIGRQIAISAIEAGDNSVEILAAMAKEYADSAHAYFRFVTKDITKPIEEARPSNFHEVNW